MKIGILTFHSQLNYGGVLQAYALQTYLRSVGHDVVLVDRWTDPRNLALRGPFTLRPNLEGIKLFGKIFFGVMGIGRIVRHWRTMMFVRQNLKLTNYHFYQWKDAPRSLGLDLIVVGSDQVWHGGNWGDPQPYLFPPCAAIAYAASLGMRSIPSELVSVFKEGLPRFSAVSVREQEAIPILARFGCPAVHVVDPVLLTDLAIWEKWISPKGGGRRLTCYFTGVCVDDVLPELENFAASEGVAVRILLDRQGRRKNLDVVGRIRARKKMRQCHVKIDYSAGPIEFLNLIAHADWVLTDSFHALVFSWIFNRDVRVLRPTQGWRLPGFGRIEEFLGEAFQGPAMSDSVEAALESFGESHKTKAIHDCLTERIRYSQEWLRKAVEKAHGHDGL